MALAVEAPPAGFKERLDDNLSLDGDDDKVDVISTPLSSQHVIFLDVDGVVNDLETPYYKGRGDGTHLQFESKSDSGIYTINMPKNIIEPVQHLVEHYEVHWLTTWREYANNEIAENLGIEPLPVISDGTYSRSVGWKWRAAIPTAKQAIANGKQVYWIEDFYGSWKTERYIDLVYQDSRFHFVDTWGCLQPYLLKEVGLM